MKKVDKEVLKDASLRLMFKMEDEEYDLLENEFKIILKQLSLMDNVKGIDDVEPMVFPYPITTSYLREDEVETPLSRGEALKNAGNIKEDQIKLPKVVG